MLWDQPPASKNLAFQGCYYNEREYLDKKEAYLKKQSNPKPKSTTGARGAAPTDSITATSILAIETQVARDLDNLFLAADDQVVEEGVAFEDFPEEVAAGQEIIRLPAQSPPKSSPRQNKDQKTEDIVEAYRWIFVNKVRNNPAYLGADWTQPDVLLSVISIKDLAWWMAEWLHQKRYHTSFDLAWAETSLISEEDWKKTILPTLCQTVCYLRSAQH